MNVYFILTGVGQCHPHNIIVETFSVSDLIICFLFADTLQDRISCFK